MNRIAQNLDRIKQKLDGKARLIVVSKYRSIQEIEAVYALGQRAFAENRVQALLERFEALPADIEWHLIGHLQTNKVKYIAPFIAMVHSVDSFKLLQEINKQAEKNNRVIDCLLQIFVASEETKFGLEENELYQLLETEPWQDLQNIRICGIMAMASNTNDLARVDAEFSRAEIIFKNVREKYFRNASRFRELSIGMSSDHEIALKHGSTLVRIGSAVFE